MNKKRNENMKQIRKSNEGYKKKKKKKNSDEKRKGK